MSCDPMISVDDLVFGYKKGKNNLNGVNFSIDQGQVVALLGPNGSGKTTMMRCINRVVKISGGKVVIDGTDLSTLTKEGISRMCTTVPADVPTDFSLTLKEFVSLGRSPYVTGWLWESDEDMLMIEQTMQDFGILHYADRRLNELSSGERARALLAKGVVQEPKVMMVDEPSAHLDVKYKIQVMEMLRELASKGFTIIMASHDLNLVTRYCDKVMLLSKGSIIAFGTPVEVITTDAIKEVFDIDVKVITDHGIPYIIPTPPEGSEDGGSPDA